MSTYYGVQRSQEYLMHYGVPGMRRGIRRSRLKKRDAVTALLQRDIQQEGIDAVKEASREPEEMRKWRELQETQDRAFERRNPNGVENTTQTALFAKWKDVGEENDEESNEDKASNLKKKIKVLIKKAKGGK